MRAALVVLGLLLVGPPGARAQLQPKHHVDLSTPFKQRAVRLSSESAHALVRGDPDAALTYAEQAIAQDPNDPWPYYDRAVALADLGRTDDAISSYRDAERRFGDDAWGRSISIWGRANALQNANRCSEASASFNEYAAFVSNADPRSAQMAVRYARQCPVPAERQPVRGRDQAPGAGIEELPPTRGNAIPPDNAPPPPSPDER